MKIAYESVNVICRFSYEIQFWPVTTAESIQKISQNTIIEKACATKTDACCNVVTSTDYSELDVKIWIFFLIPVKLSLLRNNIRVRKKSTCPNMFTSLMVSTCYFFLKPNITALCWCTIIALSNLYGRE